MVDTLNAAGNVLRGWLLRRLPPAAAAGGAGQITTRPGTVLSRPRRSGEPEAEGIDSPAGESAAGGEIGGAGCDP